MDFSNIKEQLKNMKAFYVVCGLILICIYWLPVIYDMFPESRWVFDDMTNPYMTIEQLNSVDEEYRKLWIKNMRDSGHDLKEMKYEVLPDGKIAPLTLLDENGMKIQREQGCGATECHAKQ